MPDWCADRTALLEQYADASNLEDRIALHRRFSTADRPLYDWQFDLLADRVDADATDITYDRSIDKRTVTVVLGAKQARRLAYWLIGVDLAGTVVLAFGGCFRRAVSPLRLRSPRSLRRAAGRTPSTRRCFWCAGRMCSWPCWWWRRSGSGR